MPYVMVPVPEDLVEDVMQYVLRAMARAGQQPWDAESFGALYDEVDELSRAVLSYVSRAVHRGEQLPETEAARAMQLTGRETMAIQRELNELARQRGRPPLVHLRTVEVAAASGRTIEERVFDMDPEVADLVRDAERAELLADPELSRSSR